MNISVFGLGYVGCVSLGCLAKNGHKVVGIDINPEKVSQINSGKSTIIEKDIDHIIESQFKANKISATDDYTSAVLETDLSIITVGTPSTRTGHLDLRFVLKVADQIGESLRSKECFHVIAIRSTVLPGTCEKVSRIIESKSRKAKDVDFAVVVNPEFLREGSAVQDYFNPPLTLIGSEHKFAADMVASLYYDLSGEIIITSTRVAEIMKYVNNAFHALKISFANEIGNICKPIGIDSHAVMDIFTRDKKLNISPYYFRPGFAYGGSCLPKDLKGLQTIAHDNYIKTPLIESIGKTNEIQIRRSVELFQPFKKQKIGFLGLSFKAGTDDLRNSPTVELIELLLGKGFHIMIYDRNINMANLTGTNKTFIEEKIPHLSKLLINDLKDLISNSDVVVVTNKEKEFEVIIERLSNDKVIIDMVRLNEKLLKRKNYIGLNW